IDREVFSETGILADSDFFVEGSKKSFLKNKMIKNDSVLFTFEDMDLMAYPDEINDQNLFTGYGMTEYSTFRFEHFYQNRSEEVFYKNYEEVDDIVGF